MSNFSNKTVLITGGTGSFGKTMAKHALESGASEVRIFSRDEAKQDSMRNAMRDERLKFFLGDVREQSGLNNAMGQVDLLFHAAALKQVPSCEFFPLEAVATNVIGSSNVISSAVHAGVESVVCLSTDKAVYPINAMGMTKGLMEKVALAQSRANLSGRTKISITRYGNVMFSRGSVLPLFIEQIISGETITVTDPKMTRFLMSLDESVALVDFAFSNANPGDLFVKKAPAATLETIIEALFLVLGKRSKVKVIGSRHGEKLYETLLSAEEMPSAQDLGGFFRLPIDERDLNYANFTESGRVAQDKLESYHSHNTTQLNVQEVAEALKLRPEIQIALDRLKIK